MQNGLYVALSGQVALERRLNTIADNVANMSTVGFRATGVHFEDLVTGRGADAVDFASAGGTYLSARQGGLTRTGNAFDFAVQGEGWFAIDTPAGVAMTRDGRFQLNDAGDLVTLEGHPVLDAGLAPIQLDPAAGPPEAGQDGSLRQDGRPMGAIGLFTFDAGPEVRRWGNSGVIPLGPPEPLVDTLDAGVRQGFVEEANVNPVLEMTRLIAVQRAFEAAAATVRDTEASLDDAVKTLGATR
ncbi:MAG TPA: flagellar basal-body rod protein FlgF [Mesorhizobium sp.]|nr:flagellar basal-body rod protein FlgF [Mesorhizobium sp.]